MTTHKEVMQQALEALEETVALCINYKSVEEDDGYQFTEAPIIIMQGNHTILALRAALAEPEVIRSEEGTCYYADKDGNPVDEPVAWLYKYDGKQSISEILYAPADLRDGTVVLPLYLHPQRRLSDEDKLEAMQPEVEEIASRLRRRHEYLYGKDAVGSVLTEAADLIERLALVFARATESAEYGWKNVAILEKARQEEMTKRDGCEKRLATAQEKK